MNKFPLYSSLYSDAKSRDLTSEQKTTLVNNISKLDEVGMELVYIIIRIYSIENEKLSDHLNLPYSGSNTKNKLKFDVEKFPNRLKQMLKIFVGKHLTTMKEESERLFLSTK